MCSVEVSPYSPLPTPPPLLCLLAATGVGASAASLEGHREASGPHAGAPSTGQAAHHGEEEGEQEEEEKEAPVLTFWGAIGTMPVMPSCRRGLR
jgi:hypothetical protein